MQSGPIRFSDLCPRLPSLYDPQLSKDEKTRIEALLGQFKLQSDSLAQVRDTIAASPDIIANPYIGWHILSVVEFWAEFRMETPQAAQMLRAFIWELIASGKLSQRHLVVKALKALVSLAKSTWPRLLPGKKKNNNKIITHTQSKHLN